MHERRKSLWARAAKPSEQDGATVIEKGQRARQAHDQELKIQLVGNIASQSVSRAHVDLPFPAEQTVYQRRGAKDKKISGSQQI
jgi:hypothetical protein